MEFGTRIKEARMKKEMTVYDLAGALGLGSPGYVSRIEGRGEIPGPEIIIKLADVLELSAEELLRLAAEEKGEKAKNTAQKKYDNALVFYRKSKNKLRNQ